MNTKRAQLTSSSTKVNNTLRIGADRGEMELVIEEHLHQGVVHVETVLFPFVCRGVVCERLA